VRVHVEQVGGEQGGFFAALPRLDLHDRVAVVVGVARGEQSGQLLGDRFQTAVDLGLFLGEPGVLGRQIGRRLLVGGQRVVLVQRLDDLGEFGVPAPDHAGALDVGQHRRIAHLSFEFGVLSTHRFGGFEHQSS